MSSEIHIPQSVLIKPHGQVQWLYAQLASASIKTKKPPDLFGR
jgi:hypothetical protein